MAKVLFDTIELSDIKKLLEEVIESKLKDLIPRDPSALTLLSRKDTAKLLCISLPTLHDWTKNGDIKAYRIGNRILYKMNEVDEALNQIQSSKRTNRC